MPLPSPNLDDRTFEQLVSAARDVIARSAPGWTDLSAGDPGIVLLEAFAYLADTTIYRLNRVPDKLYVEFLKLIGVRIQPPTAAVTELVFTRDRGGSDQPIDVPRGTRATLASTGQGVDVPIFATMQPATIAAGASSVSVRAIHAELVEGELLGIATGAPGLWFTVARPPVIASSGDPLDLVVGVEASPAQLDEHDSAIEHDGRSFRIWREVDDFADLGTDRTAYIADRTAGTIILAPAARIRMGGDGLEDAPRALAAVPDAGREVRAWYRQGGGPGGNVAAGTIATLRDPLPGVVVTNVAAATGGRAPESLANALIRGPQDLHSLSRAVTARDFQLVAERSSGGVARAHAFTQAAMWRYATPGTVEVVLVPALPEASTPGAVTADQLESLQSTDAIHQVQAAIDGRRPLGTRCVVSWARYKTVRVQATIVVQREEDLEGVRARVDELLHLTVDPLPTLRSGGGWPFGQALYASNVYKIILSEPGVRYARGVRLVVDDVPDHAVGALVADLHQPRTWYVGSGGTLFRSLNDGDGWEPIARFEGDAVRVAKVHPDVPGLLAVASAPAAAAGSSIHVSWDSGETWPFARHFGFLVEDVAWVMRDGRPLLLMATGPSGAGDDASGGGLYELGVTPDADPLLVLVDATDQDRPFYAVTAFREVRGESTVAVASQGKGGVYLSRGSGAGGSFGKVGLEGEDVRVLAVQADGPRAFLWAGTAAPGGDQAGKGCFRRELLGAEDPVGGWEPVSAGWTAGSCWGLAFDRGMVLAATQQVGVMRLDSGQAVPTWVPPTVDSGLPLRDTGRFHPIDAVAASPAGGRVMTGGPVGVYRTVQVPRDQRASTRYETCSLAAFTEQVTLPPTWLFVCGQNELDVQADATT